MLNFLSLFRFIYKKRRRNFGKLYILVYETQENNNTPARSVVLSGDLTEYGVHGTSTACTLLLMLAAELELLMQPGQVDTYGCSWELYSPDPMRSSPISTGLHCPLLHMAELRNEHRPSPSL